MLVTSGFSFTEVWMNRGLLWKNPPAVDPSTVRAIHPQVHQLFAHTRISAPTSGGPVIPQDPQPLLLLPTIHLNQRPRKRGLSTSGALAAATGPRMTGSLWTADIDGGKLG